jgi:hypothetical protein
MWRRSCRPCRRRQHPCSSWLRTLRSCTKGCSLQRNSNRAECHQQHMAGSLRSGQQGSAPQPVTWL